MNVISYCLFETKNISQRTHRDWDIYKMEIDRYWYNIPSVYIANNLIYPDFTMKMYISSNLENHPLYPLLNELSKQNNFMLYKSKANYNNTEPTMWRMIPYWDKDTDILLCRDIDSLPTMNEVAITRQFMESQYLIHTMRTHKHHTNHNTSILAGLCGFKPKQLSDIISVKSFQEYFGFSNGRWGCDQDTLIEIFYDRIDKEKYFLDSPISTNIHNVPKKSGVGYLDIDTLKIKDDEFIKYIDSLTVWSGEPIDSRGEKLKELMKYDNGVINNIFDKYEKIREFYEK